MKGISFVLLNVADVWLTKWALGLGAVEANPIMVWLGLEVKIIVAVVVVLLLARSRKNGLLTLLNIGMGLVVLWNAAMIVIMT